MAANIQSKGFTGNMNWSKFRVSNPTKNNTKQNNKILEFFS